MFVQYLLTTHVVWCSHRRLSGYATLQCIAADSERESLCQCHPHSSCSVKQMGFYRKTKKEKKIFVLYRKHCVRPRLCLKRLLQFVFDWYRLSRE